MLVPVPTNKAEQDAKWLCGFANAKGGVLITETVHLVDWDEPENNDFAVVEEVTLKGSHERRPDVVLYLRHRRRRAGAQEQPLVISDDELDEVLDAV